MATQSLTVRFMGETKHLRREVSHVKQMMRFGAVAAGAAAVAAGVGAITKGLVAAGGAAREFETEIKSVYSLMTGASKSAKDGVARDVRDIAKEFGITIPAASKLAYDAISNGIDPSQMRQYASEVGKTALAIGGTLEDTGKLFLKIKANYRDLDNAAIGNTIANAIKYGAANGAEMAANLGDVLAIAKSLKVSMGDSAMAYAALVGTSGAEQAKTQIGEFMAQIANNSAKFARIGITAEFAGKHGIVGVVKRLQKQIQGNPVELHKYLGTKNAKLGFQNLLTQLPLIEKGVKGIQFDRNTRDLMFGERTDTLTHQMGLLRSLFNDIGIEVGEGMLPGLKGVVAEVGKLAENKEDIAALARAASDFASAMAKAAAAVAKTISWLQKDKELKNKIMRKAGDKLVTSVRGKVLTNAAKASSAVDTARGWREALDRKATTLNNVYWKQSGGRMSQAKTDMYQQTQALVARAKASIDQGTAPETLALLKQIAANTTKVKAL